MSKPVDRISEARKRIKWELQGIAERKAELDDKIAGLRVYVDHLEGLLAKAKQASSNALLEDVIRLGELRTRIKPSYIKLSKYLAEKEIEEKLRSARAELKEILEEIQDIERRKRGANICFECQGQGQKRETRYVRDDGMVHPIFIVKKCALCGGKGRIE